MLDRREVGTFFRHVPSLRYRAALMLCYGAGLRISQAVSLKVTDIDSARMLIRVERGKGAKDRYAMLSPRLLKVLRCYWRAARPRATGYLFPSWRSDRHLTTGTLGGACRETAKQAGFFKRVTAHTLRHSFATVSPRICSKGGLTAASFRRCSATAAPKPRPATRRWPPKWWPELPVRSMRF